MPMLEQDDICTSGKYKAKVVIALGARGWFVVVLHRNTQCESWDATTGDGEKEDGTGREESQGVEGESETEEAPGVIILLLFVVLWGHALFVVESIRY